MSGKIAKAAVPNTATAGQLAKVLTGVAVSPIAKQDRLAWAESNARLN